MKIKEIIKEEKDILNEYIKQRDELKVKWIKLPSTIKYIEFLDNYIEEKQKFIKIIELKGGNNEE